MPTSPRRAFRNRLPARTPQRRTGLALLCVGNKPSVTEGERSPRSCPIELRIGIPRPVSGGSVHFQSQPIIEVACDRSAHYRHAAQHVGFVSDPNGELVTRDRPMVSMPHRYEAIGIFERDWDEAKGHRCTDSLPRQPRHFRMNHVGYEAVTIQRGEPTQLHPSLITPSFVHSHDTNVDPGRTSRLAPTSSRSVSGSGGDGMQRSGVACR